MLTNDEAGDIIKSTKEKRKRNDIEEVESTKEIYRKRGTDRQKHNLKPNKKIILPLMYK